MFKLVRNLLILGTIMLLFTGCATPTVQPTELSTQEVVLTSTPIIVVVTATPKPVTQTAKVVTSTHVPPTKTSAPVITFTNTPPGAYNKEGTPVTSTSSITITSIKETSSGKALINWNATGTFSSGFRIYYSDSFAYPFYGGGYSEYAISDGLSRSAYIEGTPGKTYYYRICSYTGSGCDFYSNSFTFKYLTATTTP